MLEFSMTILREELQQANCRVALTNGAVSITLDAENPISLENLIPFLSKICLIEVPEMFKNEVCDRWEVSLEIDSLYIRHEN